MLVCLGAVATARADERREAFLEAIHHLENPRNSTRPGAHGELGAYQFRISTWIQHTSIPFRQALNRETSDAVAIKHYEWLKTRLEAARVPATNYNLALAWNGGLTAAVKGRAMPASHSYARRAVNLAKTFEPLTTPAQAVAAAPMGTQPVVPAPLAVQPLVGGQPILPPLVTQPLAARLVADVR
jgi:hypothetical protein